MGWRFALMVLLMVLCANASADTLDGPNLPREYGSWTDSGMVFTALEDATLIGFWYGNHGGSDSWDRPARNQRLWATRVDNCLTGVSQLADNCLLPM